MGILKSLFDKKNNNIMEDWKHLTTEEQLEQIKEDSINKPIVLFKHSTRCGISLHAKDKLETAWDFTSEALDFYYLDLLKYRNISTEIASLFNVIHQSPQIIVLKNKEAIDSFSHQAISVERIKKSLLI